MHSQPSRQASPKLGHHRSLTEILACPESVGSIAACYRRGQLTALGQGQKSDCVSSDARGRVKFGTAKYPSYSGPDNVTTSRLAAYRRNFHAQRGGLHPSIGEVYPRR